MNESLFYQILKIDEKPSKHGGIFFYVYFKSSTGSSFFSCIYPSCRNYVNWKDFLTPGIKLSNLRILKGKLIDADSIPSLYGEQVLPPQQSLFNK